MRILVTGATGFTGTALVRHLSNLGIRDITGIARSAPSDPGRCPHTRIVACDLLNQARIHTVMVDLVPDRVIHLAGLNRGTRADLFLANVTGTKNLLDAVHAANPSCRILIVSSSAVYGYAGQQPIDEETPLKPVGDYGVSKAAQEEVALAHNATNDTQVAIARPFNLVGPGQPDTFLCARIVKQAVEIERGQRERLDLQETRSYRDFVDVRDAVRAYWELASHPDFERVCSNSVFNVGSGKASSVSDVISLLEEITGRTYVVDLPEDPPVVSVPFQQADISRIRKAIGWRLDLLLKESLKDMFAVARANGNHHS